MVKSEGYKLDLGINLFEEMFKTYGISLDRKKVPLNFFKGYSISPQRRWLMVVLPKETLQQMLEFLSPSSIGKILGINKWTIARLAEYYGIELKLAGYYLSIRNSICFHGESSQYYEDFNYWLKYLGELGEFKKQ